MISSLKPERSPRGAAWMIRKYAILTAVAAVAAVAVNSARTYVRERAETPPDDDPSALTLGLDDRVYSDPDGRFSLTIPAAWSVRTGGQAEPQDVVFRGPLGLEVWVRLTDLGHDRFERMSDEIRKIEESFGVNQNIRVTTFLGRPAIERRMRLFDKEAMTLDLLIGSTNHHVQLASRREAFDSLLPLLRGILDTYTPGGAAPSGAETRAHGGDRP